MTRDELIIREAKKHYYDDINCHNAFLHGVEWAEEHQNVWHNVKEEPNKDSYIIIEIADENSGPLYEAMITNDADDEFWKFLTSEEVITRWAYINDLLPKNK